MCWWLLGSTSYPLPSPTDEAVPTLRNSYSALAAVAISACAIASEPPPSGVPILTIAGTVTDTLGQPVHGAWVWWHARGTAGNLVFPDSAQQTAPAGAFQFRWDTSEVALDTVWVTAHGPGCGPTTVQEVVRAAEIESTTTVDLVLQQVLPAAHGQLGQVCATAADREGRTPDYALGISIDLASAGDTIVSGRWRMNFSASIGDYYGDFAGVQFSTQSFLLFTADTPRPECRSFRLVTDRAPDGAWGPAAVVDATGCIRSTTILFFVEEDHFSFFP